MKRAIRGFTLIELMVVVAITAILLAAAAPSFTSFFDKQRVKNAASQLYGDLQFARSEAVQRNRKVKITFASTTTAWCYIIHTEDDTCTCSNSNSAGGSCTTSANNNLKHVAGSDFKSISLTLPSGVSSFTFEPQRGGLDGVTGSSVITFTGTGSASVATGLNPLGRVRVCAPAGSYIWGYAAF
jgi:type IV fimbrial biogenesis protein FimT